MPQDVLPFPPTPSASKAGRTMQESTYSRRLPEKHLPQGTPNILIVLIDDAGPGLPSTFGGEVTTNALSRVLGEGIGYNRFHTTAMCSPTRASLLTGRNHHRIGNGQIAELANDWDGYAGEIPKSSALVAEVLKDYGYATAAFGKWHNTPALETSATGPFHNWPTGNGFEYFYGFLAGEASQYEPNLVRNTTVVLPPKSPEEGYHLSEDLADDAIAWLHRHQAFEPDKPFFMYWASGCLHGPHHIMKEWADRYQGKFDDGWEAYRERTFARAKEQGWIPEQAVLTPRDPAMPAWDDIPESERPFHTRSMEVAAGFAEHVDVQVGRLLDEVDHLGLTDNTLVFYIWGDNGSSGEGQNGTISELLAQNGIPTTVDMHIQVLDEMGGLDLLGSPKVDNMYHAGWAWAGSTPYKGLKLLASHLGGTRNPMAVRWPTKIAPDSTPRTQFHHCNDLVPTIYEIVGSLLREWSTASRKIPSTGSALPTPLTSLTLKDDCAPSTSRSWAVVPSTTTGGWPLPSGHAPHGFRGCLRAFGSGRPTTTLGSCTTSTRTGPRPTTWPSLSRTSSRQMRETFSIEAAKNSVYPVGGGLWIVALHPELRISTPYREWNFTADITRMPEFCAPALGNRENRVTITADLPASANGVLYALGGAGGGLTCYFDEGFLCYEYNLFILQRTKIRSAEPVAPGRARIEIETAYEELRPGGPLAVALKVNGTNVGSGTVPISAPLLFTANDCLDIGVCLGGPVSLDYYDRAPFPFSGKIDLVNIRYTS